jgi:hypothetical protein
MNQSEFETDLRRQGYQVFYGGLQAGMLNPEHTHEWDARTSLASASPVAAAPTVRL